MNIELNIAVFKDGQRACPNCGSALPAHETWPGARLRYCGSATCTEELRKHDNGRYVAHNTVRCEADGCSNYVSEGFYRPNATFLCCSSSCWRARMNKRQDSMFCSCGCGQEVLHRVRVDLHPKVYVSAEHRARHEHELFMDQAFGRFRPIVEDYFKNFAELHYRNLSSVRSSLGRFFRFLNESDYRSLEDVDHKTITKFLIWVSKNNRGVKSDLLSCITTFFKWLETTEKRSGGCPVNSFLHHKKKAKHLPRPLSNDELNLAWEILLERGDARLRLAFAIAEESGTRIGEICRLHVSDIDAGSQRLFIRLPTKNNRERYVHFGHKTAKYLREWLAERDPTCGHDMLLYNYAKRKSPFDTNTLGRAFSRVLCKTYLGKVVHDRGFDRWSTHRLRHTMATRLVAGGADAAVVMAAGGWIDPDTMAGYVKIDESQAKQGYVMAMRAAEKQQQEAPRTRVLSLAEFSERRLGDVPAESRPDQTIPTESPAENDCV